MISRDVIRAIATFRQTEQPEWFAHIHPHGHATSKLARGFAATCSKGIRAKTLDEIECGAHLHDIGKYVISRAILLKPGLLNKEERTIMSLHSIYGAQIVDELPCVTDLIHQIVLYHHEKWDGTGYPEGLTGLKIPFAVRVVSIVDVYTSLRARRSYKPTLSRSEACEVLKTMAGRDLDPGLAHDFLRFVGRGQDLRYTPSASERYLHKDILHRARSWSLAYPPSRKG